MSFKENFVTKKSERNGYYSYFAGQNIIYLIVTMFLAIYYTDFLGIPAAAVGTIMLVARVWDAVNDPMLSIFVEKANLKGGKFKPWIKAVAIAIPILTVILFSFTNLLADLSLNVRIIYASITYIAWGMTYTISDAPAFALATVMTNDMDERNTLISNSRLFAMVGAMIAMIGGPLLAANLGWTVTATILAVIAFVLLIQVNKTEERVKSTQQSPSLKNILDAIFGNKYIVIFVLTLLFMNGLNFGMGLSSHLAVHVYGNLELAGALSIVMILPMVVIVPFLPRLIKKFGKNTLLKVALLATIVFSIIIYLVAKDSFVLFMVLSLIKGILAAPLWVIGALYFADAIEYDYYRKNTRFEAAVFSAQTFSNKAISAISGAGGLYLLAIFGFQSSTGEAVTQTAEAINGIWLVFNIGPAVGALIALVFFSIFYDLNEKKLEQMGKESGKL